MVYTYEISLEIFHGASPVIFQANRWGDFGGCLTKPSFSGYLSDRPHEINTGSLGTHIYIYYMEMHQLLFYYTRIYNIFWK